ncbi:hypothetical protein Vafri_2161 [Volvox africanus]|nr:hypothetical protein Vafri_2161 [Volvox africanus]
MTSKLVLGLDVGTQGTKAVLYDLESHSVVAKGNAAYGIIGSTTQGRAEQHPETWRQAVKEATAQVLNGINASCVVGIGVSGQQHGLVVLGDDGQVLRPAKLWCDTESAAEADELSEKFGWKLVPSFTITKLLWLKRHEPEVFDSVRSVLLPHDYINYWLTGRRVMECGDASGTGVLDVAARQWDVAAMDAVDPRIRSMFPPLASSPEEVVGPLLPELASELGLPAGVVVALGSGDNAMSALGAGAAGDGETVVSLGTSGTIFAKSPIPILDPTGVICPFCDATGSYLPLLCTLNCTRVLEEVGGAGTEERNVRSVTLVPKRLDFAIQPPTKMYV